jgi:hypothetical protein
VKRAPAILLVLAVGLVPQGARSERSRYEIRADLAPDLTSIDGEVRATVINDTAAPVDALTLWLYPNVFAREPAGVGPVNREYYRPFGPGLGGIEVSGTTVAGRPATPLAIEAPPAPVDTAWLVPLPAPLAPGEAVAVAVRFRTRVPRRLGLLATDGRVLTATGGWHPYFTAGDARNPASPRRPPDATFEVTLEGPPAASTWIGRQQGGRASFVGPFVPLWARPPGVRPIPTPGGRVWPLRSRPEAGAGCTFPDPAPVPGEWVGDDLAAALARIQAWADGRGLPDPGPIDLFQVPLASELALPTGGGVAVSDRFYGVPPLAAVRRLHDRALARAVLAERLLPWVRARERPEDVPQVADALGAFLAASFIEETAGHIADVAGLLSLLDFVPSLDAFLRSPKSAFPHVYFLPITEPIPVRDEPWTFNVAAPRGNQALEKTVDWIGEAAVARAVDAYLAPDRPAAPFVAELAAIAGEGIGPFWRTWNERIYREDLRVRRLGAERTRTGVRTRIEVERVGDAPPERIEAAVADDTEAWQTLAWRAGAGERSRVFTVETPGPVRQVRVDPRQRVTQAAVEPAEVPALGDVDPGRLQLLLTRFGLAYSVPDRSPYGEVEAMLRRRDDVRRRFGVGAGYRPALVGGRTFLAYGFGPLVDAARYAYGGAIGLEGAYLRRGFGGEGARAGWSLGPSVGLGFDDRPPVPAPESGDAWTLVLSGNIGTAARGGPLYYAGFGIGGLHLEPLGKGHVLALRLRGSALTGSPPTQALLPLGGTDEGLRGFTLEEVLGERRVVGGVEWRLPLLRALDENLLVGRLRSIGGALFAEGAFMTDIRRAADLPPAPEEAWFGDVGAGLRVRYDFLGVQPLIVSADAALPLGRLAGTERPPITVLLRAGQSFSLP